MPAATQLVSAGAVVAHKKSGALQILLVHRPRYDDWSFPKGKPDPHEHLTSAAVREVAEETGLDIRLGPPLPVQAYQVRNGRARTKRVHYWVGRLVNGDDVSRYRANDEIDEVAWLSLDAARDRLTYPRDRDTLESFLEVRKKSFPLVVLRHAKARSRDSWRHDDAERPLTKTGHLQAQKLVPLLGAYGVRRLVSSTSRRCWTSIVPYAEVAELEIETTPELAEEDATPENVDALVARLLALKEPSVVCTHRPVLPLVWEALAVQPVALDAGALAVVHHRRGKVVAVETHAAPSGR